MSSLIPIPHCIMPLTKASFIKQLAALKDTTSVEVPEAMAAERAALSFEKKLHDQLALLKVDMISTLNLQSKIAELQEAKASADEKSFTKDQQISELQTQLNSLRDTETRLTDEVAQMKLHLAENAVPQEGELNRFQEDLNATHNKLRSAAESEVILTAELEKLKENLRARADEVASITCQMAESEKKVTPSHVSFLAGVECSLLIG
jgi:chromosome segregation ATPase